MKEYKTLTIYKHIDNDYMFELRLAYADDNKLTKILGVNLLKEKIIINSAIMTKSKRVKIDDLQFILEEEKMIKIYDALKKYSELAEIEYRTRKTGINGADKDEMSELTFKLTEIKEFYGTLIEMRGTFKKILKSKLKL